MKISWIGHCISFRPFKFDFFILFSILKDNRLSIYVFTIFERVETLMSYIVSRKLVIKISRGKSKAI